MHKASHHEMKALPASQSLLLLLIVEEGSE